MLKDNIVYLLFCFDLFKKMNSDLEVQKKVTLLMAKIDTYLTLKPLKNHTLCSYTYKEVYTTGKK